MVMHRFSLSDKICVIKVLFGCFFNLGEDKVFVDSFYLGLWLQAEVFLVMWGQQCMLACSSTRKMKYMVLAWVDRCCLLVRKGAWWLLEKFSVCGRIPFRRCAMLINSTGFSVWRSYYQTSSLSESFLKGWGIRAWTCRIHLVCARKGSKIRWAPLCNLI